MSDPAPSHLDRRSFLIGGAVIAGSLYVGMRLAENRFDKAGSGQVFTPNAFLRITPDDKVTVIIGKSEMGQGVYTGLAMAAAASNMARAFAPASRSGMYVVLVLMLPPVNCTGANGVLKAGSAGANSTDTRAGSMSSSSATAIASPV